MSFPSKKKTENVSKGPQPDQWEYSQVIFIKIHTLCIIATLIILYPYVALYQRLGFVLKLCHNIKILADGYVCTHANGVIYKKTTSHIT